MLALQCYSQCHIRHSKMGALRCHDPDASGHETCITTVCSLILILFVCSPCAAFVRTLPPVTLSMITHCLTRFDCVYQCLDLCLDLCPDLVYKPCVHIV